MSTSNLDPHRPLREDVRLLGELLGETLRTQAGEALFDAVENVRARTKRARTGDHEEFAALERDLADTPDELAALQAGR